MLPDKWFADRFREMSFRLLIFTGIGPESSLLDKSRVVRTESDPIESGIEPVNLLLPRFSVVRDFQTWMLWGIDP
jgi:hypothetical protein